MPRPAALPESLEKLEVLVSHEVDNAACSTGAAIGRAAAGDGGAGEAVPPSPAARSCVVLLVIVFIVTAAAFLLIVVVVVGEVAVERGRGGKEGEDWEVLAEGVDAVADDRGVAAAGAGEGGLGGGGEHPGQARLAESMAAVQQQRHPLLLVVPAVAHRATRHLHLLPSLSLHTKIEGFRNQTKRAPKIEESRKMGDFEASEVRSEERKEVRSCGGELDHLIASQ